MPLTWRVTQSPVSSHVAGGVGVGGVGVVEQRRGEEAAKKIDEPESERKRSAVERR